jgi:hypothetical protein
MSSPVRFGADKEGTDYVPAGEGQGIDRSFGAEQVAGAFDVDIARVHRAMAGEFDFDPDSKVDSRQAQHLAEVLLGDQPLDVREAATMRLGAFTPRPDEDWGLGDTAPGEESDRMAASADVLEDERASQRSSHDPAQRTG